MKAETPVAGAARQEWAQGGQLQARNSGDPAANATSPHDKSELVTDATEGGRMLRNAGNATDDDMAPGG